MRFNKTFLPMLCVAFVAFFFAGCSLPVPSLTIDGYIASWNTIKQASSYEVNVDGITFTTKENSVNLITYLQKGSINSIKVRAFSGSYFYSTSEFSNSESIIVGSTKLATPLNLAVNTENNCYDFSWDSVENADHYCIKMVDSSNEEQIFHTNTNSFDATGKINASGEITVSVFAYSDDIRNLAPSEYSASIVFCHRTLLSSPTNTKLAYTTTGLKYSWNAVKGADSYNVSVLGGRTYNTTQTSLVLPVSLSSGDAIFVNVQAVSDNDALAHSSAYSDMSSYYTDASKAEYTGKTYSWCTKDIDFVADSYSELEEIVFFTLYYRINISQFYASYANNSTILSDIKKALSAYSEIKYINFLDPSYVNSRGMYVLTITNYGHTNYPNKVASGDIVSEQNVYVQPKSYTDTPRSGIYDSFKINQRTESMMVYNSDQLYYAIEKGCKPIFPDGDNPAKSVYEYAKNILRQIIDDDMTDYQKVLAIYDWVTYTVKYDYNVLDLVDTIGNTAEIHDYRSFYIEGVFFDGGQAVCDGIGKTIALLCGIEGIDCYKVTGVANGGGHAWNKVKLDLDSDGIGEWYAMDSTWTDLTKKTNNYSEETLSHGYFLRTDAYMESTTHTEQDPLTDVAETYFDYYKATTYDGVNSIYIQNSLQLETLCVYLNTHDESSMEFKTTFSKDMLMSLMNNFLYKSYMLQYYNGICVIYAYN